MKLKFWLLFIIIIVGMGSTFMAQDAPLDVDGLKAIAAQQGRVRVIVTMNIGEVFMRSTADRDQVVAQTRTNLITALAGSNARVIREYQHFPLLALEVDAAALDLMARSPLVAAIEQNQLHRPALDVSAVQVGARGDNGAWERGFDGTGWAVAVLDTGVNRNHPALQGKVISEVCYGTNATNVTSLCPGGLETGVGQGSAMDCTGADGCGHGSHVAGIVASQDATFRGVAPGANIIAVKVFSRVTGSSCAPDSSPCVRAIDSDVLAGLDFVFGLHDAVNIAAANMSLAGGVFPDQKVCDEVHPKWLVPLVLLRSAGIAPVVSSGNEGHPNGISNPACLSPVVSVGMVNAQDKVHKDSNSANFLDLLAPGVGVMSVNANGGFLPGWGTSMAAPHVAAAFAIIKQAAPNATVDLIENALKSTGIKIKDPKNGLTFSRIQISYALDKFIAPLAPDWVTAKGKKPTKILVSWERIGQVNVNSYIMSYKFPSSRTWDAVINSTLSFADHVNLLCSTKYQYAVQTKNQFGTSGYSPQAEGQTKPCLPPTKVKAQLGFLGIGITWDAVEGAVDYKVEYAEGSVSEPNKVFFPLVTTDEPKAAHLLAACQSVYTYRVIAQGRDGESAPSSEKSATSQDCVGQNNLISNGGFETNEDTNPNVPDGWTLNIEQGNKVVSNDGQTKVARTGNNAFLFRGAPQKASKLTQSINLDGITWNTNDRLHFSGYLRGKNVKTENPIMRLIVTYGDNTQKKLPISLTTAPSRIKADYVLHHRWMKLKSTEVKSIDVSIQYNGAKGRLWFDNVALTRQKASDALSAITTEDMNGVIPPLPSSDELIPLPDAPPDLRGTN